MIDSPVNININLLLIQAGFKGHKTRKELKSKANEKKEATPKKDHEGSKSKDASKSKTVNILIIGLERRSSDISVTLTMDLTEPLLVSGI